jgi:Ca-activated chloride channel family protein
MRILTLLCLCLAACNVHLNASADVTIGNGGYAAMDEVPVTSGELRLAVPQVTVFEGEQRDVIAFPLTHTNVHATVGGMMALYDVEQTFDNPFDTPLEAVYVFPLGDDGAVNGYDITIGERTIHGEINTKEQARKIYDDAKAEGHTAGLVEQNKPNMFTQHIANIAPHESIKVTLHYVELLDYDDGSYTMAVPLTIGPRYMPHNPGHSPAPPISYTTQPTSTVSFSADIDAGVPIVGVESPSHTIVATPLGPTKQRVVLGRTDEVPNRDLIVRYKTAGPQTTVGLLTHRVDTDGYFMLAVQPKGQYRPADIMPREVVLVLDRSGSMDGQPLAQAKSVASAIISTLTERDSFNVVAFASGVDAMSAVAIRGDAAGKARGMEYLAALQSGGGTEMEQGVAQMLMTTPGSDKIRVVYFLTDGFVGNDDVIVNAASRLLGTNRIFTVGIGSAPNRSLLDRLAAAGRGYASYLTLTEPADKLAKNLVEKSAYPYMTDVSIDWGGLDVDAPKTLPDVYAGQPLVITGRYKQPGAALIKVNAWTGGRRVAIPIQVALPTQNNFEPVSSLWARREIEKLMAVRDQRDIKSDVTQLGLKFHLVTEFTSFVAVDRSRVVGQGTKTIVQPSMVPEGVNPATTVSTSSSSSSSSSSDDDGGGWFGGGGGSWGGGDSTPEPWWLFAFFALGGVWLFVRRSIS